MLYFVDEGVCERPTRGPVELRNEHGRRVQSNASRLLFGKHGQRQCVVAERIPLILLAVVIVVVLALACQVHIASMRVAIHVESIRTQVHREGNAPSASHHVAVSEALEVTNGGIMLPHFGLPVTCDDGQPWRIARLKLSSLYEFTWMTYSGQKDAS